MFRNLKITFKNSRFYYPLSISIILLLVFVLPNKGSSQSCASYAPVTRTTSLTYTSIAGSSPNYFTWRNFTSNQNDDNRAFPVSIGFDFWYLGVRYTQFSGNLNGFIDFSTSTNDGNNQSEYGPGHGGQFTIGGVGSGSLLTVAPLYDDLWTAGGTTPIATSCFYKTTGIEPNRVTTIEWMNFDEFNSSTGSLNFQIKLYETTGVIEFIYGTMTQGSIAATYATGINNTWPTGAPNATQLLTQQTVNTTTFSNTAQNALVTLPASNSMLSFTPPIPNAAPTGLSFSAITGSSMTLNWTNTATNEIGYVIYNSIDGGTTYDFVSQTAANAVSSIVTGLSPSTTYDWKIITVTDGGISTGLTGTQATAAPTFITSIASTSWNTPSTWDCTCVPSSGDVVTIANSHIVTLDVNGSYFDLNIGGGTSGQLTLGNNGTSRSLTINGNLIVNAGATLTTGATNATHTLTVKKDFTNNGTVQLAPTASRICNVTFNRNGNQTLSGSGATTNLNLVTLNMGNSISNIFEVTATNFTAPSAFLTLTNGTFKLSSAATLTLATANVTINNKAGIWSNHASAVLNYNTGNVILLGLLRSTLGSINVGSASNNLLSINGGSVIVDGGTINVASSLDNQGISALVNVTVSSGTLLVNRFGLTTAGLAPFGLDETGSTFNMSGGSIILQNPGAGNLGYTNTGAILGTISGGTIQIGNASTSTSRTFLINSLRTIPNLTIGGGVATTAQLATNNAPIQGDLTINSGNTLNLSTFTANRSSAGGTLTVAGSMLLGNNTGGETGSNFPTNYSALVLTGGTVNYNRAAGGQTIFATPTYTTLTMGNTSGTQTAGGNITTTTLNNNTANIILDMATFTLAATTITNNATATIRTQNTSSTPIPTGITIGGTVNYNATTGGQTIRPNTYTNLTMGNTSGTQTATANLASTGTFTTTAGGTLDMGSFTLTVATVAHAGVLNTQNTSATPVTTGKTWGGTVNYNTAAGGQTVMSGTYGILTMGNTSGTQTANGNIIATTVNNNTNAANILNMVTFTLVATTVNNTGTIRTQNVSGTPLQASITYGGTVQYDGVAQTVVNASYNNLTLAGSLAKTLNAGMTSIAGNLTMSGTATATLVANVSIAGDLSIGTGTTLTFSTFTANRSSAGCTLTVAGSMLLGNNTGGQTGSNFPTNYSSLVLTGGTVNYNRATGGQTIFATPTYTNLTSSNTSGIQTLIGAVVVDGILTLTSGGTLAIGSNSLTINGTISGMSSTAPLRCNASSSLTIGGSGALGSSLFFDQTTPGTTNRLLNLTINRSSQTITLGNATQLAGTYTPTAGTLAAGNNLTLVSDATNTARIANGGCTTCSYITGNVSVQRHVPATARRWRFMGSPLTTATLADWQAETYITGTGGAANGFDPTSSNQASVYGYNESVITGDLNTGWEQATNVTNSLVAGKGYRVFIRGDRSDAGRLTGTNTTQNAVTLDLVGPVNQGDITMPVSFTSSGTPADDGWCLLANPYASPYDWNAHFDNGTFHNNIDASIQVLSAQTGGYVSYNASSNAGTLTGGIIPPGAAFWVKATGASPSLTFKEQFKVATTPLGVFKTEENESFSIRLEKDSITSDALIVKYMDASTTNFDTYDIRKMAGTVNISSYGSDNVQLSLTVRPTVTDVDTIKLNVSGSAGTYKLIFNNSQELGLQDNALLIDNYLATVTDLKVASEYSFSIVTGTAATQGLNRFYIVTGSNSALPVKLLLFTARKEQNRTVSLNWSTAQEINNSHFELQRSADGRDYETIGTVRGNGTVSKVINYTYTDNAPKSINYYRLKQVDFNGTSSYSAVQLVKMDENASALQLYPVPANNELTIDYPDAIIMVRIYDITGKLQIEQASNNMQLTLDLESIRSGAYILELTTAKGEVVQQKFMKQ